MCKDRPKSKHVSDSDPGPSAPTEAPLSQTLHTAHSFKMDSLNFSQPKLLHTDKGLSSWKLKNYFYLSFVGKQE